MECPKCGNILDENETSCKNCGAKIKENTLNSISKGGGKTQLPSPEEKAEVQREQIEKARIEAQKEAEAQAEIQDYIARQQLMAANKKNNMALGIVVVMIVVTLIFGGILLHQKYSAKDSRAIKDNSNSATKQINGANGSNKQKDTNPSQPAEGVEPPKEKDSTTAPEITGTTDVQIGKYTFSFPNNYQSKVQEGMGISIDYYNKIQFVYTVMEDVSYNDAVSTAKEFSTYLKEVGFAVNGYNERTYSNRKWLVFDGVLNDMAAMYAITKINDNTTFQVTIYNLGSIGIVDMYTSLGTIIDNVKINGSSVGGNSAGETPPSSNNDYRTGGPVSA